MIKDQFCRSFYVPLHQIQQAYNLFSYAFLEKLNKYSLAVKSAASVKYLSFILSKVIHKLYLSPLPVVFKIYIVLAILGKPQKLC